MAEDYITYSLVILFMSACSIIWEVWNAKTNETNMIALTRVDSLLPVLRDSTLEWLDSSQVTVGDAIILSAGALAGCKVPCDMVLIQGNCVMDESSLTGESVPVVKTPLSYAGESKQLAEKFKSNLLFSGSVWQKLDAKCNASQDDPLVVAIVLATGFNSQKGQLFRGILYPKKLVHLSNPGL